MFEEFSGGYYLSQFYVEPSPTNHPAIHTSAYNHVHESLYGESDGIPPVMKLGDTHMIVESEPGIPQDTLVVPESILEQTRVDNPPSLEEVLLAKREYAQQLLRLGGVTTSNVSR